MKAVIIRSIIFLLVCVAYYGAAAQAPASAVERGSQIAKAGFRNESEIRDKFNGWRTDEDAREWLGIMGYDHSLIRNVVAFKPNGQKADVVVLVSDADGPTYRHGISIKLVSTANGFNQIDKRWLRQYARMWDMPDNVVSALRLFLGEDLPVGVSKRQDRMFLNELADDRQRAVLDFFRSKKERIAADVIKGEGDGRADWFMVAWKIAGKDEWKLVPSNVAINFFSEGPVEITRSGNLRIGRITLQRKGGDGGRETAKMMQFKINPVQLFELK
ncbi:hypothetical protein [Leptolyngbya sp. 7M]|uniref:hypothetical protein n=1 Tax=Leptolyngbya sp. 7M TaxID=2812896 RepID=UPI001B8ACC98|nr:hypothetical protein [Leptolyngbya sp. 7M]QYO66011.1 hypothetical protein JVX88_04205 [Leptolyngbya sp. 7M]